ncbi:MAG: tetratricopeptide repeat protein [Myxococcota bacterium]
MSLVVVASLLLAADEQAAQQFFRSGELHYASGEYGEALADYERAYELSPHPALLFNMANAQERLGRFVDAHRSLRRYIESAAPANAAILERRLEKLMERQTEVSAERAERDALGRELAEAVARGEVLEAENRALQAELDRGYFAFEENWEIYTAGGVALLGLTTWIVAGQLSRGAGDDAAAFCDSDGICQQEAAANLDRERDLARAADAGLAVGLLGAAAAAWFWLSKENERPVQFGVGPSSVSVYGRF